MILTDKTISEGKKIINVHHYHVLKQCKKSIDTDIHFFYTDSLTSEV